MSRVDRNRFGGLQTIQLTERVGTTLCVGNILFLIKFMY